MMTDLEIFKKISELKQQNIAVCLATIIETTGSTPREVGAKMIICVDGAAYGTVGGGCGENQVRSAALRSTLVTQQPEIITIDLTDDLGTKGGDVCGGSLRVFIEPL
jgi:xanthine dehydrogenase accessory factor